MEFSDSLILGILQGITEFLPISSSGHLVLGEHFLGLKVATLKSFDVVLHLGTLLAILVYFWRDIKGMIFALGRLFIGRLKTTDPYARLIFFIIIGTVPAVFLGLFAEEWIDLNFRNVKSVGMWMFIIGVIFVLGEFAYKRVHKKASLMENLSEKADEIRDVFQPGGYQSKEIHGMNWWKAIIIGIAQSIALIPGVSRSGSTIVAGLFQGIERSAAARFSFLLGIPAIAGAGLLTALKIPGNSEATIATMPMITGFISSFIFGLLSVSFLMKFLKRNSLAIFAIYLMALGLGVFV